MINLKYRGYFSGTKLSTNPIKAIWIRFQYVSLPKYYYYSGNQGAYQWKLVNMKGYKNNNNIIYLYDFCFNRVLFRI